MRWNLTTVAAAGLLGACATYSEKIPPTYVSPVIYEHNYVRDRRLGCINPGALGSVERGAAQIW